MRDERMDFAPFISRMIAVTAAVDYAIILDDGPRNVTSHLQGKMTGTGAEKNMKADSCRYSAMRATAGCGKN